MWALILAGRGVVGCAGNKEEGQTTSAQPDDSQPPAPPSGFDLVDSYQVAGELQTLFSADDSLWAISYFSGQYGVEERVDVQNLDSDKTIPSLPHADQRSYGWTGPLKIAGEDVIAAIYQSNTGYHSQDGTHHGIILFDTDGNLLADHDLYGALEARGPSASVVDPDTGRLYVLINNQGDVSSEYDTVDFGSSAIVEIAEPLSENSGYRLIPLASFKNASAMALKDGQLVVAAANNTLDDSSGTSFLVFVDPATDEINPVLNIPDGVGLNGNVPASTDGRHLFTGSNADGRSLALLSADDEVQEVDLPDGFQVYVANAQFVGSSLLFNVTQSYTETLLMDPDSGDHEVVQTTGPVQFGISPVLLSGNVYCDGASGTDISAEGLIYSQINCYQATWE
ncbi:MAG: hypothetical protein HYU99_04575 [Deltaproteobacteria bacterium]|nr:hypothetical protein [Deltaproteobacteria bacterium]